MLKTKLYVMWKNIRQRCYNPKNNSFKYYGAKGIKMCEDWNIFNNFQLWAKSNGYKEGLSIERIDVSKNYEPQNCKFIPWKEQAHNKTNTGEKYITRRNNGMYRIIIDKKEYPSQKCLLDAVLLRNKILKEKGVVL